MEAAKVSARSADCTADGGTVTAVCWQASDFENVFFFFLLGQKNIALEKCLSGKEQMTRGRSHCILGVGISLSAQQQEGCSPTPLPQPLGWTGEDRAGMPSAVAPLPQSGAPGV